jgi:hypothetical protein
MDPARPSSTGAERGRDCNRPAEREHGRVMSPEQRTRTNGSRNVRKLDRHVFTMDFGG